MITCYAHRDGWGPPEYSHAEFDGERVTMIHKDMVTTTDGMVDKSAVASFIEMGWWIEIPDPRNLSI